MVAIGDPGAGGNGPATATGRRAAQLAKVRKRGCFLSLRPVRPGICRLRGSPGQSASFPGSGQRPSGSAAPRPRDRLQRAEPGERETDALAVPPAVRGLLTQLTESERRGRAPHRRLAVAGPGKRRQPRLRAPPHPVRTSPVERPGGNKTRSGRRCRFDPMLAPGHSMSFPLSPLEDWAIGQLLRKRLPRWTPPMSAGLAQRGGGGIRSWPWRLRARRKSTCPAGAGAPARARSGPVPPSLAELR